jgi:hypothetical protein
MSKSISEHLKDFLLDREEMAPLQSPKPSKPERVRPAVRSSISAIPPPDLSVVMKYKPVVPEVPQLPEEENLIDTLCSSYKFVVNYGVFEANFEWLPCEV